MATQFISPWAAGQDAMLNFLAQREAKQIAEQERERKAQLEAKDRELRGLQIEGTRMSNEALAEQRRQAAGKVAAEAAQRQAEQAAIDEILTNPDKYPQAVVESAQLKRLGITPTAGIQLGPQRDSMAQAGSNQEAAMARLVANNEAAMARAAANNEAAMARVVARAEMTGGSKPITPQQKLAARNQAQRQAEREIPMPMMQTQAAMAERQRQVRQRAKELEYENLTLLGVAGLEPPAPPAPPRGKVYTSTKQDGSDIHLGAESKGKPPAKKSAADEAADALIKKYGG